MARLLEGESAHRMPLTRGGTCPAVARPVISRPAAELFPGARAPVAARAGLLLFFDCWEEAHEAAQAIHSPEGSYWHAIVHRQEPDSANSAYWFRQVGRHPVFTAIFSDAAGILARYPDLSWKLPASWDPVRFIEWCEEGRRAPGSDQERAAIEIQHAEWVRLLDWCAS